MNPSELKREHESRHPESYMFDRKTMKFFGDTMKNFGCRKATINRRELYEVYRKRPVKHGLQGSFYFDVGTFERVRL